MDSVERKQRERMMQKLLKPYKEMQMEQYRAAQPKLDQSQIQ